MSLHCLYNTQPPLYQFVYIIHYFGLAWILVHLVMDILHVPAWAMDIYQKKERLSMFYSRHSSSRCKNGKENGNSVACANTGGCSCNSGICRFSLKFLMPANYSYFHWLLCAWVMTTLTWTVFVSWSTGQSDGIQKLAIAIISQIVGYFISICAYYYYCFC